MHLSFVSSLTLTLTLLPALASAAGTWSPIPELPIPRQEHSTASLGNTIYVLGGVTASSTGTGATIAKLQSYVPGATHWHELAPLPVAMNHINSATASGRLWALGGLAPNASNAWVAHGWMYSYDPKTDVWTDEGVMPGARGAGAIGVWRNKIVIAGGMNVLVLGGKHISVQECSMFDTVTRRWTFLPSLPEARNHLAGGVVGDEMFAIGGRVFGQDDVQGQTWVLDLNDPKKKGWVARAEMIKPRGSVASAVVGQSIYVFGGEGNKQNAETGVFADVDVYDVPKDRWRKETDMVKPRHGMQAVELDGRLYIPGGGWKQGGNPLAYADVFTPGEVEIY